MLICYDQVYLERVSELDKITADRDEQRKYYDDCKKQRFNDFMDGLVFEAVPVLHLIIMFKVWDHHGQVEGDVSDDHPWWRCRT